MAAPVTLAPLGAPVVLVDANGVPVPDVASISAVTELATAGGLEPYPLLAGQGDSRWGGAFEFQNPGAYGTKYNWGAGFWVETLTNGRIRVRGDTNYGISGQDSVQILARTPANVADAVAKGVGVVILVMPTNDRSHAPTPYTYAQSIANMEAIETLWREAGIQVVWIAEMPRGGPSGTPLTAALAGIYLQDHFAVRRWILSRRSVRGVRVVDVWGLLADNASYANSQLGYANTGLLVDGLHPASPGGFLIGQALASAITDLLPPGAPIIAGSSGDTYYATTNTGAVNLNPTLQGTGAVAPTGSGNIATSYLSGSVLPVGVTAVYSKVTVAGRDMQQVVIGGTTPASGTVTYNILQRDTNVGTNGVAVGNTYQLFAEYEIDAAQTGLYQVAAVISANPGGTNRGAGVGTQVNLFPTSAHSGTLITDPFTLPVGTTSVRTAIQIGCIFSTAMAATIRIKSLATIPV